MFLGSFTKHPSQSAADHMFKSVLCGRCGTINYHPLVFLKILKVLEGGNATGVRQSSMLQFYAKRISGEEAKHVHQSTSATFVLPVRLGTCVAVQTETMETDMLCGVMAKLKHVQNQQMTWQFPLSTLFVPCVTAHV